MDLPRYSVDFDSFYKTYSFISIGVLGQIRKGVQFKHVRDYIFNLVFGDWDGCSEQIDDRTVTNNGDMQKVLTTVAHTVIDFIDLHPGAVVFSRGSTPSRTRLYQMQISINLPLISESFYIEGFLNGKWEPFSRGKNYEAFMVMGRKIF